MKRDRVTGVILDGHALEWCEARAGREGAAKSVGERADLPLPPPADEGDATALAAAETATVEAIRAACRRVAGPVAMGLPAQQVLLRVLNLPAASPEELDGMVRLQADKFSPFPIETMVVSHEVIERTETGMLVLAALAREDAADGFGRRLRAAGMNVKRVDVASLGRIRSLRDAGGIHEAGRSVAAFLDPASPELVIFQRGVPLAIRPLDVDLGASPEVLGEQIAGELDFTLMGLEVEHPGGSPSVLTLWHPDAPPTELADRLGRRFPWRVECRRVDSLPSAAYGLARRYLESGEEGLDLTPHAWRSEASSAQSRRRLMHALAAIVILWVVFAGVVFGGAYLEERRLDALKVEREALRKPALAVRDLRRRVFMLERYAKQRLSALECLRETAELQPQGVDLTAFTYRRGESLKVAGEAAEVSTIYDFKNKVDASKLFPSSALRGPTFDARRKKNVFDIEIKLPEVEE